MGLVLDSSVLIAAERDVRPISELLAALELLHGETEIVLSSITALELEHGFYRADTVGLSRRRREYPDRSCRDSGGALHAEMAQVGARPGDSVPRPVDRSYGALLWIRRRHAEPAPFPDDPRPQRNPALSPLHYQ